MPSTSLSVLHSPVVVQLSMPALQQTSRKRVSVLVLVTLASSNGLWCYYIIVMLLYRLISALMHGSWRTDLGIVVHTNIYVYTQHNLWQLNAGHFGLRPLSNAYKTVLDT